MKKNALIKGTFILTAAGLFTRCIGFFYRIFLSRTFGEEGMGIYELMSPVLALVFAFCTSGIQSAVSKFVAACPGEKGEGSRLRILLCGIASSGVLSVACAFFLYQKADYVASALLMEPRCAPLLRIAAFSFPAACIHCCINGYYYGIKKAGLPAFCQLFEQIFRVGSVFLFWNLAQAQGLSFSITIAAVGLVIGELASTLAAIPAALLHFQKKKSFLAFPKTAWHTILGQMFLFAAPLSCNRVLLHLLGAIEAARIPVSLQRFGYSSGQALSIYGVFTGMAMTCILFPGALTNSVSVLLMPLIAEADARADHAAIQRAVFQCIRLCMLMGFVCMAIFLLAGDFMGNVLFHSELTGRFIRTLSFLCPFLYLNTTLFSILNGLGKTLHTFLLNMFSLLLRLAFVFFAIPLFGIKGYLWGMLAGQLFTTACCLYLLLPRKKTCFPRRHII